METIYDNAVDVKTLSSRSSTIQEGPRRLLRASVLGLGLLSVFLLAGLIGLAVHYHNSVGGAAADLSSVTEERDTLKVSLTEKTREVECLKKMCPEGWRKFGCSCYLLSTETDTWEQSRQHCTAGGADLVIVDSEEEQEFITSMIKEQTWIGLSDREEEGTWTWVDGSPLTLTLWSPAQPDNFDEEDCAEIRSIVHSQSWNDKPCKIDLHWICEKEA
ncbi:CD209 antigen-like protein C [Trematomus bernacchii]|uniref:CD209 antigen-like protein C n=1 Tax=Trematomus bernacchii TaxID=40690 RepID=UPI00146BA0F4|nr:CD209 antigen-like protein C [Trematomus bernacchii]